MSTYTVTQARKAKDVEGQHGPMQVIELVLQDETGSKTAEWYTKAATPLPQVGSQVEGTIEQGQYGLKFKKAFNPAGRPEDPKRSARIQRMHAQEMGLRYLQAKASAGQLSKFPTLDELRVVIEWFDADTTADGRA